MRNSLIALGSIGAFGIALVACGGGGSSSGTTPASVAMPAPMATQPVAVVNNSTNATAQVTIHLTLPTRTTNAVAAAAARAYVKKTYGRRFNDPHIRTMGNTSPTAAVRASGLAMEKSAKVYEQQTGRSPEFVSPSTQYVELVLTSGATVEYDTAISCTVASSQCTATFTVPLGTYTASLFLYDNCDYLLAAGTTSNVVVTQAGPNSVTITLNGIASVLEIASSSTSFTADPTAAQSGITLTVTPMDADYNTITTPGVLLDTNFFQIGSVTLAPSDTDQDVTPQAPQTLTVNPNLSLSTPASTYSYAGTGTESTVEWDATPVETGSQVVPSVAIGYCAPNDCGYSTPGKTSVTYSVSFPYLYFATGDQPGIFSNQSYSTQSYATLELASQLSGSYYVQLYESLGGFTGNVTVESSGCGNVLSGTSPPLDTLTPYANFTSNQLNITFATSGASNTCVLTATDDAYNPRSAILSIYVDSTTLTVQNKTRKY